MKAICNLILSKILSALPAIYDKEAAFYRMQIEVLLRILESKGVQRILATPDEISQLTALGKNLDHDIKDRIMIVCPKTYNNWLRRNKRSDEIKRPGRKRSIAYSTIAMVIRLVKENPGWSWLRAERRLRIVGELKKLGITIAASSVVRICKDNHLPLPSRKSKKLQISVGSRGSRRGRILSSATWIILFQPIFFSKNIHTLKRKFQAYSLVFVHIGIDWQENL